MSAKADILTRLRGSLDAADPAEARLAAVRGRLAAPPRIAPPGRVRDVDLVETFRVRAEEIGASVARVAGGADLGPAIAAFLQMQNLPGTLKLSPELAALGFPWPVPLRVTAGGADADDMVGVALARAGVAETGTVIMAAGPHSPTKLNFLPETHIVVLPAARIVATYERGFDIVRGNDRAALLPRVVNWISGPSRTADIEQTLLVGVHGPKRLHIVIVDAMEPR